MTDHPNPSTTQIDFDLHQIVGIRLIDPSLQDTNSVSKQLGLLKTSLNYNPDILIRFVDRLAISSTMQYLDINESGYTDNSFVVLRSKHKASARVQIAFDQIGQQCEITCERGLPAVPLLIPIINLTALVKGALPIHASAFQFKGKGILTTGWSKGGKTEMLMAFMMNGATYIGDEWIYINNNGKHMHGIPEPIRLWDWHLQMLPSYRTRIPRADRIRLGVIKLIQSLDKPLSEGPVVKRLFAKMFSRLRPVLKHQLHVDISPRQLFKQNTEDLSSTFDKVFFLSSNDSPEIVVQPIDPLEIASRMVFSYQYEQMNFLSYYWAFRFAFPQLQNDYIVRTEELQRQRLMEVLANKESFGVYHPYPVSLPALYEAVYPFM
jgi:hypothetical protein